MQLRGQVLKQEAHPALNGLGGDDVIVIQHEGDISGTTAGHLADQYPQHRHGPQGLRGA